MKNKTKQKKEKIPRVEAYITDAEKERLNTYLFCNKKTMVAWVKEKIAELPKHKIQG